jgi:phosphatidate cytidylyltransferase
VPGRSELTLRVLSAIVMAPAALAVAYLGGRLFTLFWGLAAFGILWEWTTLVTGGATRRILAVGGAALAGAGAASLLGAPEASIAVLVGGAILAAWIADEGRRVWVAAGVAYAGAALILPVILRADPEYGLPAIVFLFAVVWSTDVFAYFVGRALGGPKLVPYLSPKKTWSGAVGGTAAAVLAGMAVAGTAGIDKLVMIAVVSFFLSVAAQVGDLLESGVKRLFGTKDASHLIPGHGGLMDRLDGFLAAALVALIVGVLRGGIDGPGRGLLLW